MGLEYLGCGAVVKTVSYSLENTVGHTQNKHSVRFGHCDMHILRMQIRVGPVGQVGRRWSVLDECVNYPVLMLFLLEKTGEISSWHSQTGQLVSNDLEQSSQSPFWPAVGDFLLLQSLRFVRGARDVVMPTFSPWVASVWWDKRVLRAWHGILPHLPTDPTLCGQCPVGREESKHNTANTDVHFIPSSAWRVLGLVPGLRRWRGRWGQMVVQPGQKLRLLWAI